ncbi:MAG: outer membrane beta-barrel protein [Saprospiraceae bacterium]|nr:outer membrane beta-barrel protein [Saprospiraceae bacterium]
MKRLIYLLCLLFISSLAISQNGVIKGKILDDEGQALEYANVLLLNASDSTLYKGGLSEEEGVFVFERIMNGSYFVSTSMVGFGEANSEVIVSDGASVVEIPTLKLSNGIEMDQVTVTAKKPFIELKADKMIVNVANSSVSAGNSALEVLEKSPGVIVDNNDNISLRGKQGVLVTINGKNQYMTGEEITRMLQNMPASNIQNIEIITQPSAKFDAEGNSGIINIVLKRNENLGTNGSIASSLRQGWKTSHNHSLNLNYRSEKVNVYGGGEYYNWGWKQNLDLVRDIPFEEGNTIFDQTATMDEDGDGYNLKLGMDWNITDHTTISLLGKMNSGSEVDLNDNETQISGDNMPGFDLLTVETIGNEETSDQTINANITHKFNDNGLTLNFDVDWSMYENNNFVNYDNFFMDLNGETVANPFYLRNDQETTIDIFASKLDLTIPVSEKVNLEIGGKVSMVETLNKTLFEHKNSEDQWVNEIERSNDFMYNEDVWAAYVNGSGSIGSYMIQAGLRMEHTKSVGESITLEEMVPREYTNLFPSVSVSRAINKTNNLSLTYSRRLERPNYRDLNPFENFLDQYTFEKGNPLLNPQYSNAFGLNYAMGRKLFVSLNYSHTKDAITQVIEQVSSENKTFQTNQNLDAYSNVSLTISMPKVWTEWWTSRINYTGFYNDFSSAIPSGTLDNNQLTHMVNLNNELQLPGNWAMEVSGRYQSGLTFGLFEIDPQGSLDFGFSKRLFDNRASVKIGISDVFRTRNSNVRIEQDDINLLVEQRNDTRRASVSFNYRFGNQKVKAARKRSTAAEEESGRI